MKPIKFRGRDSRTGKYVFGKFCRVRYGDNGVWRAIIDEEFVIDEDSIAHFTAYDKYGCRVYEGDIFDIPSGDEIANILIKNLRLKEVEQ